MTQFNQRLYFALWSLALAVTLLMFAPSAHANVYATDLRLNGGITNIAAAQGAAVNISYILNEPASLGVAVAIMAGSNTVRTLMVPGGTPGTLRGTNLVVWDGKDSGGTNLPAGRYSVGVTAATSGYTNWTQITDDGNPGSYVWEGRGIAVDRNAASPYYGRVFVANAGSGPGTNMGDQVGILKLNADGSPADEGGFATGGHAWAGDLWSPWKVEVSEDDSVYIDDLTTGGWLYRWDPTLATNSQLYVLRTDNWAAGGSVRLSGPAITGSGTNTQIWMADSRYPGSEGIYKYSVGLDGACATNDTGTVVVGVGGSLDVYPADVALDPQGNIYTIQDLSNPGDSSPRVLRFPAYDPSTNGGAPLLTADWAVGGGDDSYSGASGIAVDPTGVYLAVSFKGFQPGGSWTNGNTKVLYTTNGGLVTNLDLGIELSGQTIHVDRDCAWDAVGNVYCIDWFIGFWRAFSPPGTNQSTTVAASTIEVIAPVTPPVITKISLTNGVVMIDFTGGATDLPELFRIWTAPGVAGPFSLATNAVVTQTGSGLFRATLPYDGTAQYYRVERLAAPPPQPPRILSLGVSSGTVTLFFTGGPSDTPQDFTLLSAGSVDGAYLPADGAAITLVSAGVFQATVTANGPMQFYRIRR